MPGMMNFRSDFPDLRTPHSHSGGGAPKTYILVPDADDKADWTEVPAGTAFDRLDDGTRYPTVPETTTDYVESATANQIVRFFFSNATIPEGDVITSATLRYYIVPGSARDVTVTFDDPVLNAATAPVGIALQEIIPGGTAAGWRSLTFSNRVITQAMADGFKAQFSTQVAGGSGTATIYACYVELTTSAELVSLYDIVATRRMQRNNASVYYTNQATPAISAIAGPQGGDEWESCDLGGGRVFWMIGDGMWATAAAQTRNLALNQHSIVGIQTGYDLANPATTLDWYTGFDADANPMPYFTTVMVDGSPFYRWPHTCIALDGEMVLVMGSLIQTKSGAAEGYGAFATLLFNITDTPDNWVHLTVPLGLENTDRGDNGWGQPPSMGLVDPGDGYLYSWSGMEGATFDGFPSDQWFVLRLDRAKVKTGDLRYPEFWDGNEWVPDRAFTLRKGRNAAYGSPARPPDRSWVRRRRVPVKPATSLLMTFGSVIQLADDRWMLTSVQLAPTGPKLVYAVADDPQGPFTIGDLGQQYTPIYTTGFNWGGMAKPEQTWSTKRGNDVMVAHVSTGDATTDANMVWPALYRVTGTVP